MDLNTNAYRVVQVATDEGPRKEKSSVKVRAGKKGGEARAKALSVRKRRQIALKANRARWNEVHHGKG
jgi:hypothetical protein